VRIPKWISGFADFCDRYEWSHREGIDIHTAADIANQRISGRQLGGIIYVSIKDISAYRGTDIEFDIEFLRQHGASNGVYIEESAA
jgi:hypothetical protein